MNRNANPQQWMPSAPKPANWQMQPGPAAYQMGYRDGFVSGLGKVAGVAKMVIGFGGLFLGGSKSFK